MFKKFVLLGILCFVFVGCKSTNGTVEEGKLIDKNLTVIKPQNSDVEVDPKSYKPVSLKIARESVPFKFKTPEFVPKGYQAIKDVEIQDWEKKEKISLETKMLSDKNANSGVYEIAISNFPHKVNSYIEQKVYQKTISLKNGKTAYFDSGQNGSQIAWEDDKIEYLISFVSNNDNASEEELNSIIDLANSFK
ncbi:hypothetical protein IGM_06701 [Bacillus cereus HuB4-4]|uniref:Lipoprotein n=1 Tax=Bacillus cereus HuB4-4 TaxID=1053211 RepID=A0A9W5QMN3_BACCE|nr:DUF4367 domain-containing protein [Bacillus cereus]EOP78057.1 hypothetical protein IGM_06701 [Bacillus cereus HuB4-4]